MGCAALALASCSSEDVVNPAVGPDNNSGDAAIGFAINTPNMSRAAGDQGLETEYYDFGAWAYKVKDGTYAAATDAAGNLVMSNYLVGYTDGTLGYVPSASQNLYSSTWFYEGLGYEENKYTWGGSDLVQYPQSAATSAQKNQYLKYWDKSYTYTYFTACAPYGAGTWDEAAKTLTFDLSSSSTQPSAMYAYARYANASMNDANTDHVELDFVRLQSQIRLAFYEVIDGYKVEIIDYNAPTYPGVICKPAVKNGDSYSAGSYATTGTCVVTFAEDATAGMKATEALTLGTKTSADIVCPIWFCAKAADGSWPGKFTNNILGVTKASAIIGGRYTVMPIGTENTDCGFTVNVSFKLTAEDTNEVIYVYGAKVHVPYTDCQWAANTLYTYYFKLTKNVPGKPTPDEPGVTPDDPYLVPIVYDGCTIQNMTEVEKGEYTL